MGFAGVVVFRVQGLGFRVRVLSVLFFLLGGGGLGSSAFLFEFIANVSGLQLNTLSSGFPCCLVAVFNRWI